MYVCMCACMHVWVCVSVSICVSVYVYVSVYLCLCLCMYDICVYVCSFNVVMSSFSPLPGLLTLWAGPVSNGK